MSPDQRKTFTARTGTAGPPRRMEELPAASFEAPDPEVLDARQARIREVRRKAPELREGDQAAPSFDVEDVPPTDSDENEEGS
ncbi:MAG: hypothetical protein H0V80_18085 [Acidobacteria bacterium]|nr:hypothetical protein [Acidobacteriota bacterium]